MRIRQAIGFTIFLLVTHWILADVFTAFENAATASFNAFEAAAIYAENTFQDIP